MVIVNDYGSIQADGDSLKWFNIRLDPEADTNTDVGFYQFKAISVYNVNRSADVPIYKTEEGFSISDHVRKNPREIRATLILGAEPKFEGNVLERGETIWKDKLADRHEDRKLLTTLYDQRKFITINIEYETIRYVIITELDIRTTSESRNTFIADVTFKEVFRGNITDPVFTITLPSGEIVQDDVIDTGGGIAAPLIRTIADKAGANDKSNDEFVNDLIDSAQDVAYEVMTLDGFKLASRANKIRGSVWNKVSSYLNVTKNTTSTPTDPKTASTISIEESDGVLQFKYNKTPVQGNIVFESLSYTVIITGKSPSLILKILDGSSNILINTIMSENISSLAAKDPTTHEVFFLLNVIKANDNDVELWIFPEVEP